MFLAFLMFLHQHLQSINPLPMDMYICKQYISEGTIQHLYTDIQETEKMV